MADGTPRDERDDDLRRLLREASDEGPIPRLAPSHRARLWQGVADATAAGQDAAPVRAAPRGATRRLVGLVAAGVAAGLVGLAVVLAPVGDSRPALLASAELLPLEGAVPAASARITDAGGQRVVELDLPELRTPDGTHLEVWLLGPEGSEPLPLGVLDDDRRHTLAPGVDLAARAVLDVSLEPDDGDPAHSGHSLLRGDLVLGSG